MNRVGERERERERGANPSPLPPPQKPPPSVDCLLDAFREAGSVDCRRFELDTTTSVDNRIDPNDAVREELKSEERRRFELCPWTIHIYTYTHTYIYICIYII